MKNSIDMGSCVIGACAAVVCIAGSITLWAAKELHHVNKRLNRLNTTKEQLEAMKRIYTKEES